jgi:hypothetical protein
MEKCESVIIISPNIGEYDKGNVFLRTLNRDEIQFLKDNAVVEYRNKNLSYTDCIMDIEEKMKKIKSILEDTNG